MELIADENGMVWVKARIDDVRDNGHAYKAGQTFHMHQDLVAAHVQAGQVELAEPEAAKAQGSPADKQQGTPKDK